MAQRTKISKGYYKITNTQMSAIIEATNNHSAMIGSADDDTEFIWIVRNIDRMLKANGLKRKFK